jgi:hypothetical protein
MKIAYRMNPRRAARCGGFVTAVASVFSTHALYNNSNIGESLVIWWWTATSGGNSNVSSGTAQVNFALTAGTVFPLFTGEHLPPGLYTHGTAAAITAGDISWSGGTNVPFAFPVEGPFAVILPGWSFYLQCATANINFAGGILYEAVRPDEFEERYWIQANLALTAGNG